MRRGVKACPGRAYETASVVLRLWVDALKREIVIPAALRKFDAVWGAELAGLFPEIATPEPASTSDDPVTVVSKRSRFIGHLAEHDPLIVSSRICTGPTR